MKKILVLFCGGTIVMKESSLGALTVTESDEAMATLLNLEPRLRELAELDIEYIDNIDSTNMKPENWDKICQIISDKYEQYDGFVITHGTDTMSYTASAISFALGNLGKPVVITGSQIPGGKIESDAKRNYINAVRIATMDISGVLVVFGEKIILGSRSSKVSESKLDGFATNNGDDLGEISIDIKFNKGKQSRHNGKLELKSGFDPNIDVIIMTPGRPVETLAKSLNSGVSGLVLSCFGPGNVAYDYLDVIKKASTKKIPVVISTQCKEGTTAMHLYDVGQKALEAGAIEGYDMTIEAITTKLMWALKHFSYEEIKEIMHRNFTGEIR